MVLVQGGGMIAKKDEILLRKIIKEEIEKVVSGKVVRGIEEKLAKIKSAQSLIKRGYAIGGIFIKKGKFITGGDLKKNSISQEIKFKRKHKDPLMFKVKYSKSTRI